MRTSLLAAGSLVAGYAVATSTTRPLGGAVLALGGALCTRSWARTCGGGTAAVLLTTYVAAFGASHPLAKQVGAWPSVLTVATVTGVAAHLVADRR